MSGDYKSEEIEITPAMLEAGVKAAWPEPKPPPVAFEYVRKVYLAMETERRLHSGPGCAILGAKGKAMTTDNPICEVCGEQPVACQTLEVGMCDDCFEEACREALHDLLGRCCCSVSRNRAGYLQICLAPSGIEHEH